MSATARRTNCTRLIGTGAAILFKGTGFYQTDYRSESYKSAAKADENKRIDRQNQQGRDDNSSRYQGHSRHGAGDHREIGGEKGEVLSGSVR